MAKPSVARRLKAVEQPLTQEPFNLVEANKALKEAVSRIVLNPESAELTLHWHHAPEQPTEGGPFYSRLTGALRKESPRVEKLSRGDADGGS